MSTVYFQDGASDSGTEPASDENRTPIMNLNPDKEKNRNEC